MSVSWTPQQRECLQAMGYRVWRLAAAGPAPAVMPAAAGASERSAPAVPPVASGPAVPPVQRPVAGPSRAPAAPTAPAEPAAPAPLPIPTPTPTGNERRLYRSLLRAAGQRTTRAAEALLAQLQIDLPAMRDDPAAKRALWTRLRALRKASERR